MKKAVRNLSIILIVLGIVFLFLPYHVEFTGYVMILLGVGISVCAWLLRSGFKWLFRILLVLMILCTVWLTGSVGIIGIYSNFDASLPDQEYAVILGAQIHGDQPSRTLRERLDTGLKFIRENPDTVVILSGGQGADEIMPESQVMYNYLESHGADMKNVYQENRSTNTRENLQFSGDLAESLGLDRTKVTIITSEFHIARAEYIAESLGMAAGGIGARTEALFLRLNYYIRESFSFVKAFVQARV